jgi:hypothetical protein
MRTKASGAISPYPDLTKVRQEPASDVWRVDERHVLGVAAVGRGAAVE